MALATLAVAGPRPADAVGVDIFLIEDPVISGSSASGSFSFDAQNTYQLFNLNSNFKARGQSSVSDFSVQVDEALTFSSVDDQDPLQPTDPGEPDSGTAARFNAEANTWDNVGLPVADLDEQSIDLGRNSTVIFDKVDGGFTDLIIAEEGGLNPFKLSLCADALCTSSTTIFDGFNGALTTFLTGLSEFTPGTSTDPAETDQAWLFRFDASIFDYVAITENDRRNCSPGTTAICYTGDRLELDYVGVGGTAGATPVPGPAGLPLALAGFGAFVWVRRRQKS